MSDQIEKRKSDHIQICLEKNVQARNVTTGFEETILIHKALPEAERDKIDLSTIAFNHKFSAPIIIEAMTGGTEQATEINAAIAKAVEQLGLGMGVGSQRAAIENPKLENSFKIAREKAPTAFLIANIGGPQILKEHGVNSAKKAVKMIKADALAIHLNPLQEAIQPEGETNYEGVLDKIDEITKAIEVPVIVKETGSGIAAEEAEMLEAAGVTGIDVAGAGGTSWAAVEHYRAESQRDELGRKLGETFWDWGIPTGVSVIEVTQSVNLTVIASGGVRSGIDAAKALAIGADMVGLALPILNPATKGTEEVKKVIRYMTEELKNAMFLVGANSIQKLRRVPVVIVGKTAEWLEARGFRAEEYARRSVRI